ncbi:HAE1 family hydrophobic/amphiphilic exporter-1 [Scopulibacillus darangshiensis]|uniref:HAE1 family hydrophobic/amphiphilic exporter-1 n=1 Tax=Scopulibacillus darangshiensis TaxID=442528 RepID=A0A4V6NQH9_9BACL|nr:efflux RND transporter permease subunit [Scopulibacillus darangshiensis]TCP23466.1 HAE1 family hydrophobic/amphiphilic exporter-1 [Scopulibacillus darangshiensis]
MHKIINFCLKNKFAVWLLTIIITVAGLYAGFNMKMETIPSITTPIVSITTTYPGAPPAEVAKEVTEPIEQQVQNLPGAKAVSSTSFQNASSIQIEYNYKKDMDEAEQEVKETIAKLHLPDDAKKPEVSRLSFNAFPIMSLSVTNDNESLSGLTKRVEKDVVPALEGIEGVSSVQIAGQETQEVHLTFDDKKMQKYGLDQETVQKLIKASAVTYPLGLYQFGNKEKSVVVDGNVTTLKDLKNLRIPITGQPQTPKTAGAGTDPQGESRSSLPPNGRGSDMVGLKGLPTVKLSDIAKIDLVDKVDSISRTNGKDSIGIQIVKAADANTVDVVNNVKEKDKELEKQFKGLNVVPIFDQGQPIEESVNTMLNKAIFGAIFAVLIILLFLRNIRTTLISIISIPLSLLIAVLILNQMGISLNIMTLGAMTVAIGRVIDDSIVVIENIYRRMTRSDEELKGADLIREATKQMFIPIMSSTIVTIAVFLPLGFVKGAVGELFLPFALTIVFSLLASLLIAITVVPMLAHSLFKKDLTRQKGHRKQKKSKLAGYYRTLLNWSLNHKLTMFGLAIILLAGSIFLVPLIGVSFLPSDEQKMVVATFNPEPGQTDKDINKIATDAEHYFLDRKGVTKVQYSVGGGNPMNPGGSDQGLFFVEYDKDYQNFAHEKEQVIKDLQKMTGKGEWKSQDISTTGSSDLNLYVYGENQKDVETAVKDLTDIMKDDDTYTDVESSLSHPYDQYTLVSDQAKLSQYGLTASQVGMMLSNVGEKPALTTIQRDGKKVNVYVQVNKQHYKNIDDLKDTKIKTPLGPDITLSDVMKVKSGKSPEQITRRDGKLYASVSSKLTTDDVGKASADLKKKIDKMSLPDGASIDFGGVTEQINESFTQLGLAMLAAIAIVYLILVITFGSALAPFAILFSLPFSIIGGLLALYLSGETISISAMIGALMLIGIVVTNAIVLIDRVKHKENEGLSTREALLEAGTTRLRPILMTAIATIGALAPLAIGLEGGGLISKGLGVTVIGGLTSSTILTLIIVPIVYEFFMKFKKKPRGSGKLDSGNI